uniref:Uncharacterized protein n=1 Tax=Caenorhabditis japonica TaxID=281687 RepID=A0A8R1I5F0_CAEJA
MPTRSTDSTKRSYVSVLERQLKFFQEDNQRVFLPNLDNTNPNHDVIYCRIPGLAEQPKREFQGNCMEMTFSSIVSRIGNVGGA